MYFEVTLQFALIHGQNYEVICIIPIFGVIFGENLGI
jgi:hypothetical protein